MHESLFTTIHVYYTGFSTPILHGLCSYGIATRHILRQYCNNDTTMVKAINVRLHVAQSGSCGIIMREKKSHVLSHVPTCVVI